MAGTAAPFPPTTPARSLRAVARGMRKATCRAGPAVRLAEAGDRRGCLGDAPQGRPPSAWQRQQERTRAAGAPSPLGVAVVGPTRRTAGLPPGCGEGHVWPCRGLHVRVSPGGEGPQCPMSLAWWGLCSRDTLRAGAAAPGGRTDGPCVRLSSAPGGCPPWPHPDPSLARPHPGHPCPPSPGSRVATRARRRQQVYNLFLCQGHCEAVLIPAQSSAASRTRGGET